MGQGNKSQEATYLCKKEKEMINPIKDLTSYTGTDWAEYLDRLCLYEIFKDLVAKYGGEPTYLQGVIRYIVWAYSKDSEKITLGMNWLENKKRIYEAAFLPPLEDFLRDILYLQDAIVLATVKKWIELQDDDTWKELIMLKDLRTEMQLSANSPLTNGNSGINYDQKFKNAKYSMDLSIMIRECELKLLQNDPYLKEAIQEVKRAGKKNNHFISPESFAK
jgi:hypothetical protein